MNVVRLVETWLHASIVLCMFRQGLSQPPLSHAVFDIERVELASVLPGCSFRYDVLLFSAGLPGPARHSLVPAADGTSVHGVDAEPFQGLMELDCGPCSWVSTRSVRGGSPHDPPRGLVSMNQVGESAVGAFIASSLVPGFSSIRSGAAANELAGLVILSSSASDGCTAASADGAVPGLGRLQRHSERTWNYTDACVSRHTYDDIYRAPTCNLRLLRPREQIHRRHPAHILVKQGEVLVDISGQTLYLHASRGWFSANERVLGEGAASNRQAAEIARLLEALRLGRSILRSALPAVYSMEGSPHTAADIKGDLELLAELSSGKSAPRSKESVFAELGVEAAMTAVGGAAVEASIPGLAKMLNPIMDGLLKPVVGLVAGTLADVVGDSVGKLLAGTVDSGLTSEIESNLGHSLTTSLTESLVPPLTESLSDAITNTLGPMLRDSVSAAVSTQLTARLSDSLAETLAATISSQLETDVPEELSEALANDLTHFLTQSVTQAVVPALTYALHHSASEDYFCSYCKEFNIYCSYCRKDGPEQLYRAQYYAAYYSKYYAAMYSSAGEKPPQST